MADDDCLVAFVGSPRGDDLRAGAARREPRKPIPLIESRRRIGGPLMKDKNGPTGTGRPKKGDSCVAPDLDKVVVAQHLANARAEGTGVVNGHLSRRTPECGCDAGPAG